MDWPDASFLERDGLVTYVEHNQNGGLLMESPDEREAPLADQRNEPWPLLAPPDLSTLGGQMLPSSSLFTGIDDDDDFMGDPAGAFALAESGSEWRADDTSPTTPWEGPSLSSSFLPSGLSLGAPRTIAVVPEPDLAQPEDLPSAAEPDGLGAGTPTGIRASATFVPLTFAAAVEPQPARSLPSRALDEKQESGAAQSSPVNEEVAGHPKEPNTATVPARTSLGTLFAKVDPSASAPPENPRRAKAIRLLAGTSLALGLLLGGYTFLQTKSKTTTPAPATVVSETTPRTVIGGKTGAADAGDLEFGNGGDFSFSEGGDFTVK